MCVCLGLEGNAALAQRPKRLYLSHGWAAEAVLKADGCRRERRAKVLASDCPTNSSGMVVMIAIAADKAEENQRQTV